MDTHLEETSLALPETPVEVDIKDVLSHITTHWPSTMTKHSVTLTLASTPTECYLSTKKPRNTLFSYFTKS